MKIIERIAVILFSIIILIVSVFSILLLFGWASLDFLNEIIVSVLNNNSVYNTILAIAVICIILSIKCIFFSSTNKDRQEYKNGVLLENEDGKLIISKDTIENLVNSVAKKFEGAAEVHTRVLLDHENGIIVNVTLLVKENAIIKDLSTNIQTKVKETIKKTSDLEVKQINIRVKNIENSKKETVKRLEPPKDIVVDSENIKNEKKSNDVQNKIESS